MVETHVAQLPSYVDLPRDRPFTLKEARRSGVSRYALEQLIAGGALRRPLRNVVVPACLPDSLLLRSQCLSLVMPPGCFATDHTAAWLHCGDVVLPPNGHLEVPRPSLFRPSDAGRLRNGLAISGERAVSRGDLCTIEELPATTPLRTAWDLGRLQRPDLALAGMDQLLRTGAFAVDELVAGIERFRGERGVVQLRVLAPRADAGAESFGESALRNRWYDAGLPRPRTQIPVMRDGVIAYYLDLGDEQRRYAAEYDGETWHGAERLDHDRARRQWITRRAGYSLDVFRKTDVFGSSADATLVLRRAWESAGH